MSDAEIKAIVGRLADLARVLAGADPNDKSEIFRQPELRLSYRLGRGVVEAQVMPAECGFFESVRGELEPGNAGIPPVPGNFHGSSVTASAHRRQAVRVYVPLPGAARRSRSVLSAEPGQAKYPPLRAAVAVRQNLS
jgi:hypothetical protein